MPKSKKPRKQKSKANNRSTGALKFEVSEDMMAIAMKIKALEATPNIDIVRPQIGSRYLGSKKGLFCSNETSITVLHCTALSVTNMGIFKWNVMMRWTNALF